MKSEKKRSGAIFLLGMVIGLIVFIAIYGVDILNFTNDSLIINGYIEKDIAQHYTGWMLFRNSPWQFPLGVGENMAYPYGSAVSYTDSIPLFAIFFKIFRNILPSTFQYFGLFVLICFMLQGGFGALITSLFNKNIYVDCIAAFIFVFSPIMIERAFRHCALTAHFLILAALYYYFKNKGRSDFKAVLPFFIVNGLAITIHPYYLPFTFGIMFAFCIEIFFLDKKYFSSVMYVLISIFCTLAIGYVIGAFYVGGSMSSIGYGAFSMNLNALYNPISKGFDNWSAVLEIKPNVSYQIEGFNYLGLGVIVFMPVAVILYLFKYNRKILSKTISFLRNYFGIVFSTFALLVFALGDWITFGGLQIFRLPIPYSLINGLFGIFRANGRFGWLFVYATIIIIIYAIVTIPKDRSAIIFMVLLLFVQIFDMRGVLKSKNSYFTGSEGELKGQSINYILQSSFWDIAAEEFDVVYRTYEPVNNTCIEIAQKFAERGKKVNTAFEARVNHELFAELTSKLYNSIINGKLENNCIVLFLECDDFLICEAKNNGYTVILVDNIYAIFSSSQTENLPVNIKEITI